MRKLLVVSCAALFSCLAIAPASARAAAPDQPTPHFTVRLRLAAGSGCPQGSTAVSDGVGHDIHGQLRPVHRDRRRRRESCGFRKNCQLNVDVGVPAGWTFGITEVQYRGYALLGKGARGTLTASYYYSGTRGTTTGSSHPLYGFVDDEYEFDDQAPVAAFAPCRFHTTLNIQYRSQPIPRNGSVLLQRTYDGLHRCQREHDLRAELHGMLTEHRRRGNMRSACR